MAIFAAGAFDASALAVISQFADRARAADGVAPFSDDLWAAARQGRTELTLTLTDQHEDVCGVAFTAHQGDRLAAELLVDPQRRRRGFGGQLLAELLDRTDGELWIWAHGDLPGARALARRHRLERARELLQLRRPVGPDAPPLPEVRLPDGVRIRTFVVGQDEAAWLKVNNAAFSWHPEQGGQTIDDIRAAESAADFDPAGFFLAVDDADQVLGFHWTKVHAEDPSNPGGGPIGEVYVVGVHPAAHGRGLGAALTAVGLQHLADVGGVETVQLYVEGDNAAALKVYERTGFTRHAVDVAYRRA